MKMQEASIDLSPFGGVYTIGKVEKGRWKLLAFSLAGPLANFLISMFLLLYVRPYYAFWDEPGNIGFVNSNNFIFQFQIINLSLALFNLIPAFPMDGARIVKLLIFNETNSLKAKKTETLISLMISGGLMITGIWKAQALLFLLGLFILLTFRLEDRLANTTFLNKNGGNGDIQTKKLII
jgi:Zn-dependent protease